MPILFEPLTGQPVQVHEAQVFNFLGKGYRTANPNSTPTLNPAKAAGGTQSEIPSAAVKINYASLKDLSERLGLSTALAKDVRGNRPYANGEDLMSKVAGIGWYSMSSKISYDA